MSWYASDEEARKHGIDPEVQRRPGPPGQPPARPEMSTRLPGGTMGVKPGIRS